MARLSHIGSKFDKIARVATAAIISIPITLVLLYLMHVLIAISEDVNTDIPNFRVKIGAPPSIPLAEVAEEPRQEPAWEPIPIPSFTVSQAAPGEPFTSVRYFPEPPGTDIGTVSSGAQILLLKVLPPYPALAIERKIEGYVIVQYDIFQNGEIGNAMIVESSDEVFDLVSLQAIRQYRYQPRLGADPGLKTEGLLRMFKFEFYRPGTRNLK